MSVSLRFGADRTHYRPQMAELELAVPHLDGATREWLWPGPLEASGEPGAGLFLSGERGPWRCSVLSVPVAGGMAATTCSAYERLLATLGKAHCLRIWNFVPAINEEVGGLENYRAFCLGRHDAFVTRYGPGAERHFCAASAVGTDEPCLTVIALSTDLPVIHLENPFQCPAYQYSEQYGPRPPSFSRGSLVAGTEPVLFISGTSAVLGSASVAPDNLDGQLATTGENLHRMLAQSERALGSEAFAALGKPACRVYLRRAGDAPAVTTWLRQQPWLDPECFSLVQADICRRELLVEIELSWPCALAGEATGGNHHAHGCNPV